MGPRASGRRQLNLRELDNECVKTRCGLRRMHVSDQVQELRRRHLLLLHVRLAGVFDELGWPWPEHDCSFSRTDKYWAQSRPRTKLGESGLRVGISEGVIATAPVGNAGGFFQSRRLLHERCQCLSHWRQLSDGWWLLDLIAFDDY